MLSKLYRISCYHFAQQPRYKSKIQQTPNNFNSLTAYLKLFRRDIFRWVTIGIIGASVVWVWKCSAVYHNPYTNRRKWMPISQNQQIQIAKAVEQILSNEYEIIHKFNHSPNHQNIHVKYKKSLQIINQLLPTQKQNITIFLVNHPQPIYAILPNQSIFISDYLVRNMDVPTLQTFIKFTQCLLQQRQHIQQLSFTTAIKLLFSRSGIKNDILLREVYLRKYSKQEIETVLSLIKTPNIQQKNNTNRDTTQNNNLSPIQIIASLKNIQMKICQHSKYQHEQNMNKGNICMRYQI